MWNRLNCYLSGRHDYGMWCEPGAIFLRCLHCGSRSVGWNLDPTTSMPKLTNRQREPMTKILASARAGRPRVVPFTQSAAS